MMPDSLATTFDSLPLPTTGSGDSHAFSAVPIAASCAHRLAKDQNGCPCLLLATTANGDPVRRPPLVLQNLAVFFDLHCTIAPPVTREQAGRFTVVKCSAAEGSVRDYFLTLVPTICAAVGPRADRGKIAEVIEDLVELFRAMAAPPRKEVQGLWGELLLIREASDAVARAWHATPGDRYDFNAGEERVEVKTTSQTPRKHQFSLEQLCTPDGTRLVICSIVVQRSGGGVNVFDLLDDISHKPGLPAEDFLRITKQAHGVLGDAWQVASTMRFDHEVARASIRYYDPNVIPRITLPLPDGVSRVSFTADVEAAPALTSSDLSCGAELLRGLPKTTH